MDLGDKDKALEYYENAITIYEKTFGLTNPSAASTLRSIKKIKKELH